MKRYLLKIASTVVLIVCSFGFSAKAAEKQLAVVVWQGDKEVYSFFVSDNPVLKVYDGDAVIKSDGMWLDPNGEGLLQYENSFVNCYISIPMSESEGYNITFEQRDYIGYYKYCAEENATGINNASDKQKAPIFSLKDGHIYVAGLTNYAVVEVYSQDGTRLCGGKANDKGAISLVMPAYKGTAVVRAGDVNIKILVK